MSVIDTLEDRFFREVFVDGVYPVFPDAKIVFDIGALMLEYSLKVYAEAQTIVALEPHPQHANRIRDAIAKYHLDKIRFFEMALSYTSGRANFGGLDIYGGSALRSNPEKTVEVETITLVDLMERNAVDHIDVLKMDIEGGEINVLTDAFPFGRVKNIVYEIHSNAHGTPQVLVNNGYEIETNKYSVGIARLK
jgi:FkbM family methyltransferase